MSDIFVFLWLYIIVMEENIQPARPGQARKRVINVSRWRRVQEKAERYYKVH